MVVFLDTSAWIKIFLEERGSLETQNFLNQAFHHDNVNLLTAPITYAEIRASLARACRGNRITQDDYENAVTSFANQWEWFFIPDFTESLIQNSGELASQYYLKGADAFQLASALEGNTDLFISSDQALNTAADQKGLNVWNPGIDSTPELESLS